MVIKPQLVPPVEPGPELVFELWHQLAHVVVPAAIRLAVVDSDSFDSKLLPDLAVA